MILNFSGYWRGSCNHFFPQVPISGTTGIAGKHLELVYPHLSVDVPWVLPLDLLTLRSYQLSGNQSILAWLADAPVKETRPKPSEC